MTAVCLWDLIFEADYPSVATVFHEISEAGQRSFSSDGMPDFDSSQWCLSCQKSVFGLPLGRRFQSVEVFFFLVCL